LYQRLGRNVFRVATAYGQVIKTWQDNRVRRVQRSIKLGSAGQIARLLLQSENSEMLNTSFVERLNLTLRQFLACLQRSTSGLRGVGTRCAARADEARRDDEFETVTRCREFGVHGSPD
jgi:hypothetical protein